MNLEDFSPFASCDWGYNAPGEILWWLCRLDGGYHIIRELKFQHMTAEDVGARMWKITREDLGLRGVRWVAADPAMWQRTGAGRGESVAETLLRMGLPMRRSDNNRYLGWLRVHELLRPMPDGLRPWLTVDPSCTYLIRTMAAMVQDPNDPDDLDTRGEDHACDALRYGAMSRPSPLAKMMRKVVIPGTVGAMIDDLRRKPVHKLGQELRG